MFKEQGAIKAMNEGFLRKDEEEEDEEELVMQPSLKTMDSTIHSQTDLCTHGGNSRPSIYPPQEWSTNEDHSETKEIKSLQG